MNCVDLIGEYMFNLKVDYSNEQYKISIEVFPELEVGINLPFLASTYENPQPIKASKIEITASTPNLNTGGNLFIDFIKGEDKTSHKRKKDYHSTKKLLKDFGKYRAKIKKAHVNGKSCCFNGLEKIED